MTTHHPTRSGQDTSPDATHYAVSFHSLPAPLSESASFLIDSMPDVSQDVFAHYAALVVNVERSMDALRPALAALETPMTPEMMQGLGATENAWRRMEDEFGLLTSQEVAEIVGSNTKGRSTYAHDNRKAGKLIGIERLNRILYPRFQFDRTSGKILPVMERLVRVIREFSRTEGDLAQWMCIPSGYLDGERPVDLLSKDDDQVVAAAEGHFGVQW